MCLLVLVVYFFIRASEFSLNSISSLTDYLDPLGINISKLDSVKIDPLQAISVRGLSVEWQDEATGSVALEAEEFRLSYTLSELLNNRFQLDELLLNKAKLTARLKPEGDSKTEPVQDETGEPLDLQALEKLLSSPPLDIDIKTIQFSEIDLDIVVELPAQKVIYQGQLKKLAVNASWRPQQLHSVVQLDMTETSDTKLQLLMNENSAASDNVLQADLIPALFIELELKINNEQRLWQLETAKLNNVIDLRNIVISKSSEGKTTSIGGVKKISFNMSSSVSSESDSMSGKSVGNGLASLFPLLLETRAESVTADLDIVGLKQKGMQLSAHADHNFQLYVDGKVLSLDKLQPMLEISLANEILLPNFQLDMPGQHASIKDLSSNLTLNGSSAHVDINQDSPLVFDLDFKTLLSKLDFAQEAKNIDAQTSTDALNASLQPEINLSASGKLASLANPLETLTVNFKPEFFVNQLNASLGQGQTKKHYVLARQSFTGQGNFDQGVLNFDGNLDLKKVNIPEIAKSFSLSNHLTLEGDIGQKETEIKINSQLDKAFTIDINLLLQNPENKLSIVHEINAEVSPTLASYLPAIELEKMGKFNVSLSGTSTLSHQQSAIQNADSALLLDWPLTSTGKVSLTQLTKPKTDEGVFLSGPVLINYGVKKNESYQTTLALNVPGVKAPPLKAALPLSVKLKNEFTWPLSKTAGEGRVRLADESVIDYQFTADDKPGLLALQSTLKLGVNPDWVKYLDDLQALDQIGQLQTGLIINAKLIHDKNTILELDPKKPEKLNLELALDTVVEQSAEKRGSLLHLNKALKLNQTLNWQAEAMQWNLNYAVEDLLLPEQMSLENMQGSLSFSAPSGLAPNNASVTLNIPRGNLRLLAANKSDELELGPVLFPIKMDINASMINEQIKLKNLSLAIAHKLVEVTAKGSFSLGTKNAQLESQITTTLRKDFFPAKQMSGNGSMKLPLNLVFVDGKQASVDGEILFDQFSLYSPDFSLQNLRGNIKFEEELLVSPDKVDFAYLIAHDPFQRVDFAHIQPYLDSPALQMQSVSAADMTVGPMLSMMLLKQNIFQLQKLDLDLFGGHLTGQFYFDATPGSWKIGLLSRISQLDPRQLLKADAQQKTGIYSPVSVRTAIDFDIHKRLLQGRVDIAEISREQLLQLLEVVDPKHEDEQLAHVRAALQLAYPEGVSVVMKQGLMDLSVSLSALPKPIEVKGLPLTPLIQVYAGDILSELDKLASQKKEIEKQPIVSAEEQK